MLAINVLSEYLLQLGDGRHIQGQFSLHGADSTEIILPIDEPGQSHATAPSKRIRTVPAVYILQSQQSAEPVAHLGVRIDANSEKDTPRTSQRRLMTGRRLRCKMVLEHALDSLSLEQLAIISKQRLQNLDIVNGGHKQAVPAKVSFTTCIHVALAANDRTPLAISIVGIQIDHPGAQVLPRNRIKLGIPAAERSQDAVQHMLAQRAPRDALDNASGPVDPRAVHPPGAGLVSKRVGEQFLHRLELPLRRGGEYLAPFAHERGEEVVRRAGAVREQHLERDGTRGRLEKRRLAVVGEALEYLLGGELGRDRCEVAVEREEAVLDALQGGDGGNQLGGRG